MYEFTVLSSCEKCQVDFQPLKLTIHDRLLKLVFSFQAIIAASMADKSPFVAPLEKRELANQSRMKFALHSSDHITIYNAFMG